MQERRPRKAWLAFGAREVHLRWKVALSASSLSLLEGANAFAIDRLMQ